MQHEQSMNSDVVSRCGQCGTLGEMPNRCVDCSQWLCEICLLPSDKCCFVCQTIFGSSRLAQVAQPYAEDAVQDHTGADNNNSIQRSTLVDMSSPARTSSTTQLDEATADAMDSDTADNSCASNLQQIAGVVLKEEGCERTGAAVLSETVPCKSLVTLMLSNLPTRAKFSDVVEILYEHGCYDNLVSFYVPTHSKSKCNGRGYIFVRFDCYEAALKCFDAVNGRYFGKKQCVVKLAHDQGPFAHQEFC